GVAAAIDWNIRGARSRPARLAASFALALTVLLLLHDFVKWEEVGRPLIFVVAICTVVSARRLSASIDLQKLVFSLFSLLLLSKTMLRARLYHYGFVLSAPALLTTIMAVMCWLPAWINRRGGSGAV